MILVALAFSAVAFVLSASAGLGGSLVLVPGLMILLGAKQGVVLAALLLAGNNVAKVVAYRATVPWRRASLIALLTIVGAAMGSHLLLRAPEAWVEAAVLVSVLSAFFLDQSARPLFRNVSAPTLALFAGASSGFSGTSGPLKGLAIRSLGMNRLHFVGAASLVSLVGDLTKAWILVPSVAGVSEQWLIVALAVPLMPVASLAGRYINSTMGERAYTGLFWSVMGGYALRLIVI